MKYTNHFNEQSGNYLQFRPDYPQALFVYLSSLVKNHDTAWDCGTGNGQAAAALAPLFKLVIATDIHQAQLDQAPSIANVDYQQMPAEQTSIVAQSIDLITVAQALHWFNFDRFYNEVKRVLKPQGILAAWCYSLGSINPAIDEVIKKLYQTILGDQYWPKERRYIDEHYATIPFPFKKITPPEFFIEKEMSFDQLLGYLNTWSAVKEYQKRNQTNPLELVFNDLLKAWGDSALKYKMHWPIHLLVGKLDF